MCGKTEVAPWSLVFSYSVSSFAKSCFINKWGKLSPINALCYDHENSNPITNLMNTIRLYPCFRPRNKNWLTPVKIEYLFARNNRTTSESQIVVPLFSYNRIEDG